MPNTATLRLGAVYPGQFLLGLRELGGRYSRAAKSRAVISARGGDLSGKGRTELIADSIVIESLIATSGGVTRGASIKGVPPT